MRVFITLFLAALFHYGTAQADPALWAATRGESTIYIFGTLHMADGSDTWRSEAVKDAFLQAGTIVLETDTQASRSDMADLRRIGTNAPAIKLSDQISGDMRPALFAAIAHKQLPAAGIERLRPWLAALVLARGDAVQSAPDPFIDRVIETEARAYGKWLIYLERPQDQHKRLAALPEADAVALLEESLLASPSQNTKLVEAWQSGETARLDEILNAARRQSSPNLSQALLAKPNAEWAAILNQIAQTDPVIFVAVGAAHTIGPDNLQKQLSEYGFHVERLKRQ